MKKVELFPTLFWDIDVIDINNDLLKSYITEEYNRVLGEMRRAHSDTEQKKHNNWSSEDLDLRKYPELLKLYVQLEGYALTALKEFNVKHHTRLYPGPTWFNVNKTGTFVAPHQHPNCVLAGVYYVDVADDAGHLKFMHPDKTLSWMFSPHLCDSRTKYTDPLYDVKPENSKFIMFPGNLQHYVEVNDSKQDRISIAFNFILGK